MLICGENMQNQPVYFMAQFFDPSLVEMETGLYVCDIIGKEVV